MTEALRALARRRGGRTALRTAALAADAAYVAAWLLAPAAAWAPWLIALGLVLGTVRILGIVRERRGGASPPWTAFCAPLLLPASHAVPLARRRGAGAPGSERIGLAVALAAVLTLSLTGIAGERLVDPVLEPVDRAASAYVDRALLQAGGTYVGARALERLLAIAGDISIGIGFIEGRPGQIFEPLRDLLDRFSTVVLAALASLTLQKVLLELGPDVALPLFVAAAGALGIAALAAGPRRTRLAGGLAAAGGLMLGTAVVLRLLVPLTGVGVAALAEHALADRQQAANATFEAAANRVGLDVELDPAPDAPPPGRAEPGTGSAGTLGERMQTLREQAEALQAVDQGWLDRLFGALIDLVAIFVIETLVAPLAVLILLWRLWGRLAGAVRLRDQRGTP